jgi:hypothetical protein
MSKIDAAVSAEKASEHDASHSAEPSSESTVAPVGGTMPRKRKGVWSDRGLLIILVVLSFIGVAISHFNPITGSWYWLSMVPLFAVAAIVVGGSTTVSEGAIAKSKLVIQVLHWGVALLTAGALSVFRYTGRLDDENFALVMLLILALATVLDGIRLGWMLTLVGAYLGLSAVIAAYIGDYLWIILALSTAIVLGAIYWKRDAPKVPK